MLHYVPDPQGLLQDSGGYSKIKSALTGKQKEPRDSKNAQLETTVQLSLGDGIVTGRGRGEVAETEAREENLRLQNFVLCSQHVSSLTFIVTVYFPFEKLCNFTKVIVLQKRTADCIHFVLRGGLVAPGLDCRDSTLDLQ